MRGFVLFVAVMCGCSASSGTEADATDATTQDLGEVDVPITPPTDVGGFDVERDLADVDAPAPLPAITLELGAVTEPFERWPGEAEVEIVFGPQGGWHTDHAARVRGASSSELHLAIIWGEVWRDDLILARGGWEFRQPDWQPSGDGLRVDLLPLVFDDEPEPGPVELRGRAELLDGRSTTFTVPINLMPTP